MLDRFFGLSANGTTVRRELLGGATTFLTMAYIVVVNPAILADAGMDFGAVFVATCIAAAIGALIMGLYANYPFGLAPGMGLNAYFAYSVVGGLGFSWQTALGAVFVSGVIFLVLSILPVREWIINAIPRNLKVAISAGIGLFLGLIGLQNAGVVVNDEATLVALGDLTAATTILAGVGFALMVALDARGVPGAVLIGMLGISAVGLALGLSAFQGIAALPPDPMPTFGQLDIAGAFQAGLITIIFAFLFVDLFDSAGTLVGLSHRAGLLAPDGTLPRLKRALIADSTATVAGAALGTSTVTSYIESATGVKAGGRTGLTAVVIGGLFLLTLFLAPLAKSVPTYATAPALVFVACLMARGLGEMEWQEPTEYGPAVVTALGMPLTYSIADGIGLGFVTYAAAKLLAGRFRDLSPAVLLIAVLFAARFAFLELG